MVLFKADKRSKDLEKNIVHEAGEEFEMTIERSKELVANIKKNHGVDLILTRTDKDEEEVAEVVEEVKEKPENEVKEEKPVAKETKEGK